MQGKSVETCTNKMLKTQWYASYYIYKFEVTEITKKISITI